MRGDLRCVYVGASIVVTDDTFLRCMQAITVYNRSKTLSRGSNSVVMT